MRIMRTGDKGSRRVGGEGAPSFCPMPDPRARVTPRLSGEQWRATFFTHYSVLFTKSTPTFVSDVKCKKKHKS